MVFQLAKGSKARPPGVVGYDGRSLARASIVSLAVGT
jgi:hypothetical protein